MIRVQAKTIAGRHWPPKPRTNRAVPISGARRQHLDRDTPPAVDEVSGASGGDWFFPSPQGHGWDPDNFSGDLRDANTDAGLRGACLDYRHTFGSQLAQKDVSLYKIAMLMGTSPEIRPHYAALTREALVGEVIFKVRETRNADNTA